MRKMLILGTSLVSKEIVQTAREMGCYTIVTDNLPPERSEAKLEADEYWMISTNDLDLLEVKCKAEKIDAVFAGVSEFNLDQVKALTERLNLPCYIDDEPWKYARNKKAFKQRCREIGIPVIEEYALSDPPCREEMENIKYPVVIKPVDGAGNKGLSICYSENELIEACKKARDASDHKDILVERYITGEESWNSYFIAENEFRCVSRGRAFKQPGYPSFLYSILISAMEDNREFKEQLDAKCIELFRSIGCRKGMAWIQFIRDEKDRYYALEMAHRMNAGETSVLQEASQGFNPVRWMLDTALGIEHKASMLPSLNEPPYSNAYCLYLLFANQSGKIYMMNGFDELDQAQCMISNIAKNGYNIQKHQIISRIAFTVKSSRDLCNMIRIINKKVQVLNEDGKDMCIRYTDFDVLEEQLKDLFRQSPAYHDPT